MTNIPCGRPAKGLCKGGPECWCAAAPVEPVVAATDLPKGWSRLKIELEWDDSDGPLVINAYGTAQDMIYLDARLKFLHTLERDLRSAIDDSERLAGQAQAAPAAVIPGSDDLVPVPRKLIAAACAVVNMHRPGTNLLEQLRRYSLGDLSAAAASPTVATGQAPAVPKEPLNQWGKPVIPCPDHDACNYHGCEAHCRPARAATPPATPVGIITSQVKGGVTWQTWPDQLPDGTKLYAMQATQPDADRGAR